MNERKKKKNGVCGHKNVGSSILDEDSWSSYLNNTELLLIEVFLTFSLFPFFFLKINPGRLLQDFGTFDEM